MKFQLLLIFIFPCLSAFSQESLLIDEASIRNREERIKLLGDSILKGSVDDVRKTANTGFKTEMKNLLQSPNTFNYSFDSLKNVSKIKSDDNHIRIYTWILPTDSGNHYAYYGFIQYSNPKKKIFKLFELNEGEIDSADLLKKSLNPGNWYGALYYKIIETKYKKTTCYSLLGWKGNNTQTTRKVIDVFTLKNDEPFFGAPVFEYEKHIQFRIVFEYNAEVSMLLHWDEKQNKIIFDHLAPANAAYKDQMQTYGPDFQYDALQWKKGRWLFSHDVDARNTQDSGGKGFTDKKNREFYIPPK